MNFKVSHLLRAVCAVAALSAFSGTASADCVEIQNFVKSNKSKVNSALFAHYGDAQKRVLLAPDNSSFMVLQISPVVIDAKGCTVQVSLVAIKQKLPKPTNQAAHPAGTRVSGTVSLDVGFDEREGLKLCVKSHRVSRANWSNQGSDQDANFVKNNRDKPYFSGCLF